MRKYDELQNSINIVRNELKDVYCEENELLNTIENNKKGLVEINNKMLDIKELINKINALYFTSRFSKYTLVASFIIFCMTLIKLSPLLPTLINAGVFLTSGISYIVSTIKLDKMNLLNKSTLSKKIKKLNEEYDILKQESNEYHKTIAFTNFALDDNRRIIEAKRIVESELRDEICKLNIVNDYYVNNKVLVKKR